MSARYVTAAALRKLAAQLTERDHELVQTVCVLRFVSGSQLQRMHFTDAEGDDANARTARRALLRLVSLGVLERLPRQVGGVRAGSAGFVYRLGRAGQRLAVERGWSSNSRRQWQSHVPGRLFLDHALQVAELHTLIVEADRAGLVELLWLEAEPACWRSYGQRATLKPDSHVRLGIGDYEDSYMIEVDMGTESSRTLERKLGDYLTYEASGREQAEHGVFPKTLWLVPDAERARVIESCIERLPRSAHRLFAVNQFKDVIAAVATPEPADKG
ncbi:MAG TPA: replication-relaxation family protein [Candidatus Saccharimonadales bacterium]|nr:replication-relaxation family protein [Candidatus Saccharimonadales bacterium]